MSQKTILITGTTSGIGEGLMKAYLALGQRVIAVNRRPLPKQAASEALLTYRADVTRTGEVDSLFETLKANGVVPDVYILNAGINRVDNNGSLDEALFEEVVQTNLMGVLRFVSRGMALNPRHKKCFVAMSSTSNIFPNPNAAGYYVSKLGVTESFKLLRRKYQDEFNDFKTVILGPVRTKMLPSGPMASRLQTVMRDMISVSVDQAVPKMVDFIAGRKAVLNYTLLSHIVFHMARLATTLMPGLYRGSLPSRPQ